PAPSEVYTRSLHDALPIFTMPEMDGLEALKEIRRIDPAARVAMVTAMGQQAIVMEALRAGAKDFVLKPFQPDRVLGALQKLLASDRKSTRLNSSHVSISYA